MNVRKWLILGVLSLAPTLLLANEFSSLEELMTLDQFGKAGLEQLSPEQLQFLNRWLQQHGDMPQSSSQPAARPQPAVANTVSQPASSQPAPATAAPRQTEDRMGFGLTASDRTEIHSSIDGEFNGWGAKARFKLANGQVWQQVGTGDFVHHAINPKVVIKPKSLGSWKLYIEGINRGVKVKRIK